MIKYYTRLFTQSFSIYNAVTTAGTALIHKQTQTKSMKKIYVLLIAMMTLVVSSFAQVTLTATAGTPAGSFTTLKGAFDAINAGTHQGSIVININANTAETAPCVLNSTGAGAAIYTDVLIKPTATATISGATTTGRGLIELNGADNITIDGAIAVGGTTRDLTITNTAVNTVAYCMAIRIAVATTIVTSANGNTIKNCITNGNATGRNIAAATSTTGSEAASYGIYAGGGASTVSATTAPSAIASVATVAGSGATMNSLTISNNLVNACARGISVQASAITVIDNLTINNNTVGDATAGSTTTVYRTGITAQGFTAALIAGNTIRNIEWFVGTSSPALSIGDISAAGTNAVIENNIITHKVASNTGTFGAYGINIAAGNGATVRNNFVSDVTGDMTGGSAFSTTFGIFGIRVAAGLNHKIYHNSVNLYGLRTGTAAATLLTAAFGITGTGLTGCDVRNNIFSNTITGGTTSIANVSMYLPSGGTSAMNLTLNNNAYYSGSSTTSDGICHAGVTYTNPNTATAGLFLAVNFSAGVITPATNLRSYTSTLSAGGTNDNASYASVNAAPYISSTNLHLNIGSGEISNVESKGAGVGVTLDIDGDARGGAPDMGADEITLAGPGTLQFSSATYGGNEGTTVTVTVSRAGGSTGALSVDYATSDGTAIAGTDYTATSGTLNWANGDNAAKTFTVSLTTDAVSDPSETVNLTLSNVVGTTITGTNPAVLTIGDVAPPFNGVYTVGSGGNYPSLTNTGGIFEAINLAGASGSVTINIISDLTGETGAVALNPIAGNQPVLIQPSGAPRTISGIAPVAVIRINGTDNVTINGSTTGATAATCLVGGNAALRELTIQNLSTSTSSGVIHIGSATEGSINNVVKNVIAIGTVTGSEPQTLSGITTGAATPGTVALFANNNNRIENCSIQRTLFGIASLGVASATLNLGTVITQNDLSGSGVNRVKRVGIYVIFENGTQITKK
ncbi:MAG: hypothetical protein IPP48_15065 [Chitinophagaceae bacterium]|nr:hypothetical protein [Chitinophagaceae bacterium]